jgi:hypothetical protein
MLLRPASAKAADGFNLTISPLPISLSTDPGKAVTTPIRVQNTGNRAVNLKVSIMKFSAEGSTGEPRLLDPTPQDEFVNWVTYSKKNFVAEPNVYNTVDVTVKPPKTAAFGYYYAVVFSQDNGNTPAVPSQNKVNGAVASLVLLTVNAPGAKRQVEVVSLKSQKRLYQYLPAKFDITVKNTGNIHVIPKGNLFISRAGKKDFIGTVSINSEQGNILPNSNRVYTATWDDGFPSYEIKRQNGQIVSDKTGAPVKELSWNLKNANKLRLGKYTASMTLVYNDGKQDVPIEGEVSFWVIPWVPFVIILVILLLVLFALFMMIRAVVRRLRRLRKPKPTE